jgi:acetyl-CoA acetyltransferase
VPECGLLICGVLRTPFGSCDGALRFARRDGLRTMVQRGLLERSALKPANPPVLGIENLERAIQAGEPCIICNGADSGDAAGSGLWFDAADAVAAHWRIPREMADVFAAESHQKAVMARGQRLLSDEVLEVTVGEGRLAHDEFPRADLSETVLRAMPSKKIGGTVTEGNVAPPAVGAAAILLCSEKFAPAHLLRRSVRVSAVASAGDQPGLGGTGMIAAGERVIEPAGLHRSDVGLWAIHELSAAQCLSVISELDLPFDRVNPWGGAIARGNAASASAVQLLGTLARQMEYYRVELGAAVFSMCGEGRAALLRLST